MIFNEITDQAKQEVHNGISQILVRVFASTLGRVFDIFDRFHSFVDKTLETRRIKKTMELVISCNLLAHYLDSKKLDCIVLTTHNGKHSESGFDYKFVLPIFTSIYTEPEENQSLDLFLNYSSRIDIYRKWLNLCLQNKDVDKSEFSPKMKMFFGKYNKICFRRHRAIFYIVLPKEQNEFSSEQETEVAHILDHILDCGLKKIRKMKNK